ncbi:MAG: transporter family-2 protein [Glaciecola sp.]|jgi:transporter family-2 protein
MNYFEQPIFYVLLMCMAGFGIPVMAALNGGLGAKLDSPALAASILFIVGAVVSLTYLFLLGGNPKSPVGQPIPIVFYMGGVFVAFYILSITWVIPRFGVANAISLVLLGQLISMTAINHFGLMGTLQNSISGQRVGGLAFMIVGVCLTVGSFSS